MAEERKHLPTSRFYEKKFPDEDDLVVVSFNEKATKTDHLCLLQ